MRVFSLLEDSDILATGTEAGLELTALDPDLIELLIRLLFTITKLIIGTSVGVEHASANPVRNRGARVQSAYMFYFSKRQ